LFGTTAICGNRRWRHDSAHYFCAISKNGSAFSDLRILFSQKSPLQNDASAYQVASKLANRSFDRAAQVAGFRPKVSERDKFGDYRRRRDRPLEMNDTATRYVVGERVAVWAAELPS
jgi:hypothetical protein